MKTNKTILVVEDTKENIDTAKKVFSKINEFNFIYAENAIDALSLLNEADMVISDRSISYNKNEKIIMQANGYAVAYQASIDKKRNIIFSNHGDISLFFELEIIDEDFLKILLEEYKEGRNDEEFLWILQCFGEVSNCKDCAPFEIKGLKISQKDRAATYGRQTYRKEMLKTEERAWKLALEFLLEGCSL